MNLHSSTHPIAFPWTMSSGWSLDSKLAIYFGDPTRGSERSAFVWGIQFMKSQLTEDFVFEMRIGYFKDLSYCIVYRIVNSTRYDERFSANNIFSLEDDQLQDNLANYWLTEDNRAGPDQGFLMDLGCPKTIVGIRLKNTPNLNRDRGTKRFRLLGSANDSTDGLWEVILEQNLEDSRGQYPPPTLELMFQDSLVVRYIKFEMLEYWGLGGGLQHFAVMLGNDPSGQFWIKSINQRQWEPLKKIWDFLGVFPKCRTPPPPYLGGLRPKKI